MSDAPIVLDVGGTRFKTSWTTLRSVPGSRFDAIASGQWLPESDGSYFLDLDPKYFDRVLNHLRCGASLYAGLQSWERTEVDRLRICLHLVSRNTTSIPSWDYVSCGAGLEITGHERVVAVHHKVRSMRFARGTTPCDQFCVHLTANGNVSDVALGFTTIEGFEPQYDKVQYGMVAHCWHHQRVTRDEVRGACFQANNPHSDSFPPDMDLLVKWHRQSHTLSITCDATDVSFSIIFPAPSATLQLYPVVGLLPVRTSSVSDMHAGHGPQTVHNTSIEASLVPLPESTA
ncbi:hypothetical protein SDRG_02228 [Saprolegnia diclina VS20]|uniref:Potassium channel tetramerisation-type BTB domain-containing protein n=1 Tax=Saprolegnia diclina (strain VS20) TaxID=1156394 RepID=T0SC13_SAPDV|nr:hypothetical protein SDRG_02228 [Saprolegnia diclina VS20]EQC40327.1 hypothetical protein SDRG_02228 [Saprolegnia diclina VS20]|eukprot:XP_008606026.1 hypothetical protein SDRG_02228 [Saprolegnia diclina VS20]